MSYLVSIQEVAGWLTVLPGKNKWLTWSKSGETFIGYTLKCFCSVIRGPLDPFPPWHEQIASGPSAKAAVT